MKILNLSSLLKFENRQTYEKYRLKEILTISPFDNQEFVNGNELKCEIGSLPYVLAMICQALNVDNEFINSLDTALLSGESNVGEEEIEEEIDFIKECSLILIDSNLINFHIDKDNIRALIGVLSEKIGADILDLDGKEYEFKGEVKELKELINFDGCVVFEHDKNDEFRGGEYFSMAAKIKDGDLVSVKTPNLEIKKRFILDGSLKGTIAFLGIKDISHYRFEVAKISRV